MHTKQALWYRPVNLPSALDIDFPDIGSRQDLQSPRPDETAGSRGLDRERDDELGWIAGSPPRERERVWRPPPAFRGRERDRMSWMAGSARGGDRFWTSMSRGRERDRVFGRSGDDDEPMRFAGGGRGPGKRFRERLFARPGARGPWIAGSSRADMSYVDGCPCSSARGDRARVGRGSMRGS